MEERRREEAGGNEVDGFKFLRWEIPAPSVWRLS
jgi:hypothetical protein